MKLLNKWTNTNYEIFSFGIHRCVACLTRGLRHREKFVGGTRSVFLHISLWFASSQLQCLAHYLLYCALCLLASCWCEVLVFLYAIQFARVFITPNEWIESRLCGSVVCAPINFPYTRSIYFSRYYRRFSRTIPICGSEHRRRFTHFINAIIIRVRLSV